MVDGFAARQPGGRRGRHPDPGGRAAVRHAAERPLGRGRRAGDPLPGRRRRRVRPRRAGDRLPAGPHPVGDRHARRGAARTARSTRARPTASRASAPRWTARTPSGWGTASGSPTRWPTTATLGPLAAAGARRAGAAGDRAVVQRADRRVPVAGRAPGRPAAPAGLRRHRQHRQPADERGLGRAASWPTSPPRSGGRGTTCRPSPSGRWRRRSSPKPSGIACSTDVVRPGLRGPARLTLRR